jgi:hypothetical protein
MSWISTKDQLPEKDGWYLTITSRYGRGRKHTEEGYFIDINYFSRQPSANCEYKPDWWIDPDVGYTHWRPLPIPPEDI